MTGVRTEMKAGIIGLTGIAARCATVLKSYRPDLDLLMYHPTNGRVSEFSPVLSRIEPFLAGVDFLFICSPTHTHGEYLTLAMKYLPATARIYCEKPSSLKELQLYLTTPRLANRLTIGYNFHFTDVVRRLRAHMHNCQLSVSDILHIDFVRSKPRLGTVNIKDNWRMHSTGGVLETVTVHFLEYLVRLFHPVLPEHVKVRKIEGETGWTCSHSLVMGSFADSTTFSILTSYRGTRQFGMRVYFKDSVFLVDNARIVIDRGSVGASRRYANTLSIYDFEKDWRNSYRECLLAFLEQDRHTPQLPDVKDQLISASNTLSYLDLAFLMEK